MTIFEFIISVLAAAAAVDVWFNGSIFSSLRAAIEAKDDWCADIPETEEEVMLSDTGTVESQSFADICPCLLADLLTCRFCMSHHTPYIVMIWMYLSHWVTEQPMTFLMQLPVYSLAATYCMTIINKLLTSIAAKQ